MMNSYVLKMKGYVETLEFGGHYISDKELINCTLDVLCPKYNTVVVSLTIRLESSVETLYFQDIQHLLQKHKMGLERANVALSFVI